MSDLDRALKQVEAATREVDRGAGTVPIETPVASFLIALERWAVLATDKRWHPEEES